MNAASPVVPPGGRPRWQALGTSGARQWQAHTSDADAQAQAQPDWTLHYQQLSGGAFSGRVHHIDLPGLRLVREDSNCSLHQQGTLGHHSIGLALPLVQLGTARFSGQPVPTGSMMVGRGDTLDLVTTPQFSLIAVVVDETLLRPLWQHMYQKPTAVWLDQQRVLPARAAAVQVVQQMHLQLMQRLAGLWPQQQGKRHHTQEGQTWDPASTQAPPSPHTLLQWRDDLLMEWIEALPEQVNGTDRPSLQHRRHLVHRALDLMQAHAQEPLSILQLCQALGTSRRLLNYAFMDRLGTSPLKYGTALRLAQMRRELQRGGTTVAQAASHWGFWHLGQLARNYRAQFGELPSQTLRRGYSAIGGGTKLR